MSKRYLKLGEKAKDGSFHDPTIGLSIAPGQVVVHPTGAKAAESKILTTAIQNGHVTAATEEEYNNYQAKAATYPAKEKKAETTSAPAPPAEPAGNDPEKMKKADLIDALLTVDQDLDEVEEDDFEDLEKKKHPELVALYKKYEKLIETED